MLCLSKISPVDTMFVYHFVNLDLGVELFSKKKGQQKKGELTLRQGIDAPMKTSIGS